MNFLLMDAQTANWRVKERMCKRHWAKITVGKRYRSKKGGVLEAWSIGKSMKL